MQSIPVSSQEKEIIQRKYSAAPFGKMSVITRMDAAEIMLVKIHTITGWDIPEPQVFTILLDQLSQHLLENYPTVNVNEVEYAFRKYGSTVKDWGKAMNLNLFDQVMGQYISERRAASAAEEHTKAAKVEPEAKQEPLTDAESIELGKWTCMHYTNVETIWNCYEVLRRLELMAQPSAEETKAFVGATKARYEQLLAENPRHFKDLNLKQWSTGYLQKLAVLNYFKNQQS